MQACTTTSARGRTCLSRCCVTAGAPPHKGGEKTRGGGAGRGDDGPAPSPAIRGPFPPGGAGPATRRHAPGGGEGQAGREWPGRADDVAALAGAIASLYAEGYGALPIALPAGGGRDPGGGLLEPVVRALHAARGRGGSDAKIEDTRLAVA